MKRLAIYLAVTFGLTWGLLIPAGVIRGTFEKGEGSSPLMLAFIAASMFFPLVGALVANLACRPQERIDLAWKPLVGPNVRAYLQAWFMPAALSLVGCAVFFAVNPQWFDPSLQSFVRTTAEATGASAEELASSMPPTPVMLAAMLVSSLTYAPFINMIPAFGEELGWRGMLFPTLAEQCRAGHGRDLGTVARAGHRHGPQLRHGLCGLSHRGHPDDDAAVYGDVLLAVPSEAEDGQRVALCPGPRGVQRGRQPGLAAVRLRADAARPLPSRPRGRHPAPCPGHHLLEAPVPSRHMTNARSPCQV